MQKELREISERVRALQWLSVLAMLLLSWWVIDQYHVEEQLGLVRIFPFVVGGFIIHSSLPLTYRQPFFILTTVGTAVYLFGIWNALILVGLVLGFLLIAHMAISFRWKVLAVFIAGLLLAIMKAGFISPIVPSNMITVAASMLMFRMIIYLYDLRNEREEVSWVKRLGYFLMLPNLIFPIFPIVDYKIYKSTYYNAEPTEIYYRGVTMVMRGLIHLLVYRVIYLYMVPGIDEVSTLIDLVQYLTMSYLTIMRLSGMFHIALGVLLIFGFNLPEIFNNYFLASGFSDYWRRINIYWKDFMLKIFYYPFYFRVKHWNTVLSVTITTIFVFVLTWLLHVYQWFWVLGSADIRATDVVFWSIFGALVTISAVYQSKGRRSRTNQKPWIAAFKTSLGIVLTFSTAALMWSIWISPTFGSWFGVLSIDDGDNFFAWLRLIFLMVGVFVVLSISHFVYFNHLKESGIELYILKANTPVMALLLFFIAIGSTEWGKTRVEAYVDVSMDSLTEMRLNQTDQTAQFENYYDEILTANNLSSPLWQQKAEIQDFEHLNRTEMVKNTGDILINELQPSFESVFKGHVISTNEWGMRDKSYQLLADSNVVRIAILGGSIEMGSGVGNNETFESLFEQKLNGSDSDKVSYESLNFSISARSLIQHVYNVEAHVLKFQPKYIMLFNHDKEWNAIANLFLKVIRGNKGVSQFPYEPINEIVNRLEFNEKTSKEEVLKGLVHELENIYSWCYTHMAKMCMEKGITPIWVHIPSLQKEGNIKISSERAKELALQAGFECIDLSRVFEKFDTKTLMVSPDDNHPNQKGHELIADSLYTKFVDYIF